MGYSFDLVVLLWMIIPPRTNRNIRLCRNPMRSVFLPFSILVKTWHSSIYTVSEYGGPSSIVSIASFISYPTNIRSCITKNNGLRLQFTYKIYGLWPIVICSFFYSAFFISSSIISISSISAIKPNFKNRTVIG